MASSPRTCIPTPPCIPAPTRSSRKRSRAACPSCPASRCSTWLDGRNETRFAGLASEGGRVRFTLPARTGGPRAAGDGPGALGHGALTGVTRDGVAVATRRVVVKGVEYAMFDGLPGGYVATYRPARRDRARPVSCPAPRARRPLRCASRSACARRAAARSACASSAAPASARAGRRSRSATATAASVAGARSWRPAPRAPWGSGSPGARGASSRTAAGSAARGAQDAPRQEARTVTRRVTVLAPRGT